jgi:hypothetical protein
MGQRGKRKQHTPLSYCTPTSTLLSANEPPLQFVFLIDVFFSHPSPGFSPFMLTGDIWKGGPWFEQLPLIAKFFSVMGLTLVAYGTHKYFQDQFITWVYTKWLRAG